MQTMSRWESTPGDPFLTSTLIVAASSFRSDLTPTIHFLKTPENILFIPTETLQTTALTHSTAVPIKAREGDIRNSTPVAIRTRPAPEQRGLSGETPHLLTILLSSFICF